MKQKQVFIFFFILFCFSLVYFVAQDPWKLVGVYEVFASEEPTWSCEELISEKGPRVMMCQDEFNKCYISSVGISCVTR